MTINKKLENYLENIDKYSENISITGNYFSGDKVKLAEKFQYQGFTVIDADTYNVDSLEINKFEKSKVIGVTGPSGAGKSTLCCKFLSYGFAVVDCDAIAHSILEKNIHVKKKLVEHFGNVILDNNYKINRKKLKSIVFNSNDNLLFLNRTIFKYIAKKVILEIQKNISNNKKQVVDAPLLFEYNLDKVCDKVIVLLYDGSRSRWKI